MHGHSVSDSQGSKSATFAKQTFIRIITLDPFGIGKGDYTIKDKLLVTIPIGPPNYTIPLYQSLSFYLHSSMSSCMFVN